MPPEAAPEATPLPAAARRSLPDLLFSAALINEPMVNIPNTTTSPARISFIGRTSGRYNRLSIAVQKGFLECVGA